MKLELKHIVGYLPHGLKFQSELDVPYEEIEKNPNWTLNGITYLFGDYCLNNIETSDAYPIHKCKPILRPPSDLIKEIEHDGEKFVAIERLIDIETKHNWSNSDYLESEAGQNEWWVKLKGEKPSYIFGYNSLMGFYCLNQFSEKQFIRNQIELYEKLYEWHFDLHSLIEKGLAIDINEI